MVLGSQACGRHCRKPSTVRVRRGGKGDPAGTSGRLHAVSHLNKSSVVGGLSPSCRLNNRGADAFCAAGTPGPGGSSPSPGRGRKSGLAVGTGCLIRLIEKSALCSPHGVQMGGLGVYLEVYPWSHGDPEVDNPGLCVNLCPLVSMSLTHSLEPGHTRASCSAGVVLGAVILFLSEGGLVWFLQFRCRRQLWATCPGARAPPGLGSSRGSLLHWHTKAFQERCETRFLFLLLGSWDYSASFTQAWDWVSVGAEISESSPAALQ